MPATKTAFTSQPSLIAAIPTFLAGPQAEELERALYEKIRQRAFVIFEDEHPCTLGEDEAVAIA